MIKKFVKILRLIKKSAYITYEWPLRHAGDEDDDESEEERDFEFENERKEESRFDSFLNQHSKQTNDRVESSKGAGTSS